jgi:sigma-B regulation protein RsbU (phosphoserine phosphatase)
MGTWVELGSEPKDRTLTKTSAPRRKDLLTREMEEARRVQQGLLPRSFPLFAGLDAAGECRPASQVGGDYYDFFPTANGDLGFAIGDVCGKGIPAALLMAMLQASLRGLAASSAATLPELMTSLNRLVYEATPDNRFATLFVGAYEPRTRKFAYVNGGHTPPIVLRHLEVQHLTDGGPVVGLFPAVRYQQSSLTLCTGDIVLFFTDGITEATNASGDEFGEERLTTAVRRNQTLPTQDLVDRVFNCCYQFAAGAHEQDDMTLVILKAD